MSAGPRADQQDGVVRLSLSPRRWRGLLRLRRALLVAQRNQDRDESGTPTGADDDARLELLEAFGEMSVCEQWARLIELQPRLADLTGQLEIEPLARHLRPIEVVDLPPATRAPILSARQAARDRLRPWLDQLVGPRAPTDDSILRSQGAFDAALTYLMEEDGGDPAGACPAS